MWVSVLVSVFVCVCVVVLVLILIVYQYILSTSISISISILSEQSGADKEDRQIGPIGRTDSWIGSAKTDRMDGVNGGPSLPELCGRVQDEWILILRRLSLSFSLSLSLSFSRSVCIYIYIYTPMFL